MFNRMKARFWWRVRDWWHHPNMYVQCVKPTTFWDDYNYYYFYWSRRHWNAIGRLLIQHTKAALYRGYWRLRWWSQLRCNGNHGGWRTRFCDWLENNARNAEDD